MFYGQRRILRTQPSTGHGGSGQVGYAKGEWGAGTDRGQQRRRGTVHGNKIRIHKVRWCLTPQEVKTSAITHFY
jgi:hypothetical protein